MRKIRFTGEEFQLLKKIQEVIGFSYNKVDHFLKDNNEGKELPEFTAKTRIFIDLIDSVKQFQTEENDDENIQGATILLQKLETVLG